MNMKSEILVEENKNFFMYQRKLDNGRTCFIIFKRGICALEEVKRMVGGGHASTTRAMNEFYRLSAIEAFKEMQALKAAQ
jgi:hypothetical protein